MNKKEIKKALLSIPGFNNLYFKRFETQIKEAKYIFMHSITLNIGDLKCCPLEFFDDFKGQSAEINNHDIYDYLEAFSDQKLARLLEGKIVIYGGGGLISFEKHDVHNNVLKALNMFAQNGGKVAIWGAGHNRISNFKEWVEDNAPNFYPDFFENFALVGTRDLDTAYEWVPCVSCMHKAFDNDVPATHEYVVFLHGAESDALREYFQDIPSLDNIQKENKDNADENFIETIKFLSSGETVITNSYHGLYWATLLGKKVIAIPNSSKFLSFKYPYRLCTDFKNWRKDTQDIPSYSSALEECRAINENFFEQVIALEQATPKS